MQSVLLQVERLDATAYTPTDLSNYYTKDETSGATDIATALNGKANTTDIYTYIDGIGIKVQNASGTRRKSINLNVPIYSGSAMAAVSCNIESGSGNGLNNISGGASFGAGFMVKTKNNSEAAFGKNNVTRQTNSGGAWGANFVSGNTLLSVGNGDDGHAHNAFEIRQNGDIYITSGGTDASWYSKPMVKLQDALDGKQETLVNQVNIKTINNESILGSGNIDIQGGGGGGKAISAGTNISITSGETADTINCTLPIKTNAWNSLTFNSSRNPSQVLYASAFGDYTTASGKGSFAIGKETTASGNYSFVGGDNYSQAKGSDSFSFGDGTIANKNASVAFGRNITTKNECEFSCGKLNNSVSVTTTFGDSGNTLFSVGNGITNYHNAFEIRQNGDIYITLDGQDVKLQDQLGGGGSDINVVQTTGTSTTDVMSQDAVTTQLNNKANKSAAVGGYRFGSTNDVNYLKYRNVSNDDIGSEIYYPKINGKGILTNNSTWAENNYNFQLVETSAITTSVTSSSTDSQIPSAKAVYDAIGDIETLLSQI